MWERLFWHIEESSLKHSIRSMSKSMMIKQVFFGKEIIKNRREIECIKMCNNSMCRSLYLPGDTNFIDDRRHSLVCFLFLEDRSLMSRDKSFHAWKDFFFTFEQKRKMTSFRWILTDISLTVNRYSISSLRTKIRWWWWLNLSYPSGRFFFIKVLLD